jgi:hypothetical protein
VNSCATCRTARRSVALGGAARTLLGVTASVEPRIALRCDAGHDAATERASLRRALDEQLIVARGRPIGAARCGACAARLDLPQRRTLRSVTVEPADAAPFTVDLELPVTRCGECASDNVAAGLGRAVRRAAVAAMEGAGVDGASEV